MNRGQTVRLSTSHIGHKSQTQSTSSYLAALSTVSVSDISSVHDARVLRVSSLGHMPENHNWPADDFHLVGTLLIRCCLHCWCHTETTAISRKHSESSMPPTVQPVQLWKRPLEGLKANFAASKHVTCKLRWYRWVL